MIESGPKGKLQPCCGNNLLNRKDGKPDPAVFESPKDFKKAATLKDVLSSDPFLDDEG
jgi:hypothetical protein